MRESLEQFIEAKKIEITLFLFGLTLIGVGVFLWKKGVTPTTIEIVSENTLSREYLNTEEQSKFIVIDVAGEVKNPGIVKLGMGSRINDALASAGGILATADKEWMAKNLNQAQILKDGDKVYIPALTIKNTTSIDGEYLSTANLKININTAGEGDLDKLPGIGSVTAMKIVKGRPYSKIEDLLEKKIVSNKVWEQIRELISTW